MTRLLLLLCLPMFLLARPEGAPSGRAGVDGETTCLSCHKGIRLNAGGGNVSITLPGSFFYRPGVRQRVRVTVNDTAAAEFGFQFTARRADDPSINAGSLDSRLPAVTAPAPGGGGPGGGGFPGGPGGFAALRVVCWNGDLDADDSNKPATGCPADQPIESIVQGRPSFNTGSSTASWEFDWIPPASNVGPVRLYAASNASVDEDHARVYTASVLVNPIDPLQPAIDSISLLPQYGTGTTFSPGTWIRVAGLDLAGSYRQATATDYSANGNTAPNQLDSVQVLIGGKPAFLTAVNPDQLDVLVPDVPAGSTAVIVKIGDSQSKPVNLPIAVRSPYVAVRTLAGKAYVAATNASNQPIVPAAAGAGPGGGPGGGGRFGAQAVAGDVLTFTGTGFGQTTPAVAIGDKAPEGAALNNVTVKIGEKAAVVRSAGLVAGQWGTYRFQMVVPDGVTSGDNQMTVTVDGVASTQQVLLPVR